MDADHEKRGKPPLDKLIRHMPQMVLEQQCTEEAQDAQQVLLYLSRNTDVSPQYLGRSLGLIEAEINPILYANSELPEQRYKVLLKWISKNGRNATNLCLIQALYDNDDLLRIEHICSKIAPDQSSHRCVAMYPRSLHFGSHSLPVSRTQTPLTPAQQRELGTFPGLYSPIQEIQGGNTHLVLGPSNVGRHIGEMVSSQNQPVSMDEATNKGDPVSHQVSGESIEHDGSYSELLDSSDASSFASDSQHSFCSQCSVTNVRDHPRCNHPIGHQLQHKLEKLCRDNCEILARVGAENKVLKSKAVYDQVMAERSRQELVRAFTESGELHRENEVLKSDLILAKETVKLVWDALEKCKDNVNRDLVPVQAQYQQLESDGAPKTQRAISDPGGSPQRPESLESLKSRLKSLQQEKEELCTSLDTVASLYKETHMQLESFQAEKAQKGNTLSETDHLTAEVDHAHREIDKLISQMEILQVKNRDLECRCEDLQQKNKRLEAEISLLKARPAKYALHPPPPQRSLSDSYENYYRSHERGKVDFLSEKLEGSPRSTKHSLGQQQPHTERMCSTCTTDDAKGSYSPRSATVLEDLQCPPNVCTWMEKSSKMIAHYETRTQRFSSDAQSLSDKLDQYVRGQKKT